MSNLYQQLIDLLIDATENTIPFTQTVDQSASSKDMAIDDELFTLSYTEMEIEQYYNTEHPPKIGNTAKIEVQPEPRLSNEILALLNNKKVLSLIHSKHNHALRLIIQFGDYKAFSEVLALRNVQRKIDSCDDAVLRVAQAYKRDKMIADILLVKKQRELELLPSTLITKELSFLELPPLLIFTQGPQPSESPRNNVSKMEVDDTEKKNTHSASP